MPYNNALFPVKSNTNNDRSRLPIDLVKLSSKRYWQFAIFFSLATVLQAIGFNTSANANTSNFDNNTVRQIPSSANNSRSIRSTFFPRIVNLIAVSTKSQSVNSAPSIKAQPTALKSTSLPPLAQNQTLLADNKSLFKSAPSIHQVKQGETITEIALEYQVSKNDLVRANQLQNSNVIFVNQRLIIPDRTEDTNPNTPVTTVANLTNLESQARDLASKTEQTKLPQPSAEESYIAKLKTEIEQQRAQYQQQALESNADSANLISTAESQPSAETSTDEAKPNSSIIKRNLDSNSNIQNSLALVLPPLDNSEEYLPSAFDGYIWPAQGVFTSGYGWRWGRLHRGIDIAAPVGTPIVAAAAGTVVGAGWHSGYGNLVKIEHLDGSVTYYAHNHRNLVTHGQKVKQGEQIAEMGSTGQSTGSHLHFEIHLRDNKIADPLVFLGNR